MFTKVILFSDPRVLDKVIAVSLNLFRIECIKALYSINFFCNGLVLTWCNTSINFIF